MRGTPTANPVLFVPECGGVRTRWFRESVNSFVVRVDIFVCYSVVHFVLVFWNCSFRVFGRFFVGSCLLGAK